METFILKLAVAVIPLGYYCCFRRYYLQHLIMVRTPPQKPHDAALSAQYPDTT